MVGWGGGVTIWVNTWLHIATHLKKKIYIFFPINTAQKLLLVKESDNNGQTIQVSHLISTMFNVFSFHLTFTYFILSH